MRGVICYYSATGNTALASEYIRRHLPVPFDLVDVLKHGQVDLEPYDVVGFATSTDFYGVPHRFETFIEAIPPQSGKPAFVVNTFGGLSGQTLRILGEEVAARGFDIFAGHSLHMPENYPPMIAMGLGYAGAPSPRKVRGFDTFVQSLGDAVEAIRDGRSVEKKPLRIGLVDRVLSRRARTSARDDMGAKHVDASACTECGVCMKACPYGAITLEPKPVFDMDACYGCWRCYNRCPERAISTKKHEGRPYYPGPSDALRARLGAKSGPDRT